MLTGASGVATAEYAKPGSRFDTTTWLTPAATVNFRLVPSDAEISMTVGTAIGFQESVADVPDNVFAKFSITNSTTGLFIVIAKVTEVLFPKASVAVIVNVYVPLPVGVPEIFPVIGSTLSPAGKDPSVTAKVIGALPPETFNGSEYAVPDVPVNPDDGAVMLAVATIKSVAAERLFAVPAEFVAIVLTRKYFPKSVDCVV